MRMREHARGALVALVSICTARPARAVEPTGVQITPVTGTSATFEPDATVADLDAGDLVAGLTRWEHPQLGFIWNETYVGFLWSPSDGCAVFEVPVGLYLEDHRQIPAEIAADRTVVGTTIFSQPGVPRPYRWTPEAGFGFLALPAQGWVGFATATSGDGEVFAGEVRPGILAQPRAARWVSGALQVLGPAGYASVAFDLSEDGSVMVGHSGASAASAQATRWIDGVETGLAPVPGATTSSARFVSANGGVALGVATIGGIDALARWTPDGVSVHVPPAGLSVTKLDAIDARGKAAVGALTDGVPFAEDWTAFVWRLGRGFTLIDELGTQGVYDRAEATDVSSEGRHVVGRLRSSVVSNGEPPQLAIVWTPEAGTRSLDEVLAAAGTDVASLYDAVAISADGTRILATGGSRPTFHDTSSMILDFEAD